LDDFVQVMILKIILLMHFCHKLAPHMQVAFYKLNRVTELQ